MIGAICGGFLFLGGILLLMGGLMGGLMRQMSGGDWLFLLGCLFALAGLGILINELYYYYRERSGPTHDEGDTKDD